MGASVTQGDIILAREIDRALVAQPFADPLHVDLGFQGGGVVKLSRAAARMLAHRLQDIARADRDALRRRAGLAVVG